MALVFERIHAEAITELGSSLVRHDSAGEVDVIDATLDVSRHLTRARETAVSVTVCPT